jgi:hypothetical protein
MAPDRQQIRELRSCLESYLEAVTAYLEHTWDGDNEPYEEHIERLLKIEYYLGWRKARVLMRAFPEEAWDAESRNVIRGYPRAWAYAPRLLRVLLHRLDELSDELSKELTKEGR